MTANHLDHCHAACNLKLVCWRRIGTALQGYDSLTGDRRWYGPGDCKWNVSRQGPHVDRHCGHVFHSLHAGRLPERRIPKDCGDTSTRGPGSCWKINFDPRLARLPLEEQRRLSHRPAMALRRMLKIERHPHPCTVV